MPTTRNLKGFNSRRSMAAAVAGGMYLVGNTRLYWRNPTKIRPSWALRYAAIGRHNVRRVSKPLKLQMRIHGFSTLRQTLAKSRAAQGPK